jgi:hypothetical protein
MCALLKANVSNINKIQNNEAALWSTDFVIFV